MRRVHSETDCFLNLAFFLALIAAICCVVITIYGQKAATKAAKNQQDSANSQPPKNPAINVDTVNVNTLNVAKQENAPDKAAQNTNKPPSYFRRLVAPENLPNLILCIIGAAGVIAAISTLRTLRDQTAATDRKCTRLN